MNSENENDLRGPESPPAQVNGSGTEMDQERLIAYLDGELDDVERAKIEQDLVNDGKLRGLLHQLQQTWDMLDELPRPHVGNSFTQSTLEIVVSDAKRQTNRDRDQRLDWFLRLFVVVLLSVAAGRLVFVSLSRYQHMENRQLLQDLPVIDNVDIYLNTRDLDFLSELNAAGVFEADQELGEGF